MHLFKFSLRKDVFQLSQEAHDFIELVFTAFYCSFQIRLSSTLILIYFVHFDSSNIDLVNYRLPYFIFFCGLQPYIHFCLHLN